MASLCIRAGTLFIYKNIIIEKFSHLPKILETPYVALSDDKKAKKVPPYKFEIEMLRAGKFDEDVMEKIKNQ